MWSLSTSPWSAMKQWNKWQLNLDKSQVDIIPHKEDVEDFFLKKAFYGQCFHHRYCSIQLTRLGSVKNYVMQNFWALTYWSLE